MEGLVELRPRRSRSFRQLGNGESIYSEQLLRTGAGASVDIDFKPGPNLRLLENSRLVTEIDPTRAEKTHATLLTGRVKVIGNTEAGGFTLWRDGRPIDLNTDLTSALHDVPLIRVPEKAVGIDGPADAETELALGSAPVVPLPPNGPSASSSPTAPSTSSGSQAASGSKNLPSTSTGSAPAPSSPAPTSPGDARPSASSLNDEEIRDTVRKQGGGFQKCYIAMVNRMTQSSATASQLPRGEVKLSFKIQPSGKSAEVKIQSTPFQDDVFNRCVIEAMSRVLFRGFSGPTIQINEFPIALQ